MKYRLINTATNEEHLCDKVTIDGFNYYVSDEKPFLNCFIYDVLDKRIWKLTNPDSLNAYLEQNCNNWKMIIATTHSIIDIPKAVHEVEKLFPFKRKGSRLIPNADKDINEYKQEGYNKSQETHPFSEEDLIEFSEFIDDLGYTKIDNAVWKSINDEKGKTTKELLQLWKEQQPKIVYYE